MKWKISALGTSQLQKWNTLEAECVLAQGDQYPNLVSAPPC